MVDLIELVARDLVHELRELERDDARGLQRDADPGDERVQVGHLREHVVADDQVGGEALGHERLRVLLVEELHARGNALLLRDARDVGRGLDPERGDAASHEVAQQVAVVAGELDHLAGAVERQARDDHVDVVARVVEPGLRERGEVGVLGEDRLGRHVLLELDQEAARAHERVERVERLHLVAVGRQEIARRRHAQVDEGVAELGPAEAAGSTGPESVRSSGTRHHSLLLGLHRSAAATR